MNVKCFIRLETQVYDSPHLPLCGGGDKKESFTQISQIGFFGTEMMQNGKEEYI